VAAERAYVCGWCGTTQCPPVPEYAVGGFEYNTTTYMRHGQAMTYASQIHPKASLITTKR